MGAIEPARRASRDAAYLDQWYADMQAAPDRDAIVTRTLGLPPELQSSSLLTWAGIAEVAQGAAPAARRAAGRRGVRARPGH